MADPNSTVAEEKREPYNPDIEGYSIGQRAQDQALKLEQERDSLRQRGLLRGLPPVSVPMSVQKARQGSRLPAAGGDFYPDGAFDVDSNDMFVHRRLRDGSLVMAAKQAASMQPSPQPGTQDPSYSETPAAPAPTDTTAPAPTDTVAPATDTVAPAPTETTTASTSTKSKK